MKEIKEIEDFTNRKQNLSEETVTVTFRHILKTQNLC